MRRGRVWYIVSEVRTRGRNLYVHKDGLGLKYEIVNSEAEQNREGVSSRQEANNEDRQHRLAEPKLGISRVKTW